MAKIPKASPEQLEETKKQLLAHLEGVVDRKITELFFSILSQGDVIALSAFDLDGREVMLDLIIKRCEQRKKELSNGR
jgi:hypothetical protein